MSLCKSRSDGSSKRSSLNMRSTVKSIESLERRIFLHAGHDHAVSGLPESVMTLFRDDGHITRTDFNNLPSPFQNKIDPRFVVDDRPWEEQISQMLREEGSSGTLPTDSLGTTNFALPDLVPVRKNGAFTPYIDLSEQPGRVLLRFSTTIGNQGQGPAIAFSGTTPEFIMPDGSQLVKQRLYTFNGSSFTQTGVRDAGRFVYHAAHGHFHYEGYAGYRLVRNVGGQPGGSVFRSDGTEAIGDKVGFCMINTDSSFTTTNSVSSTTLPGYNASGQPSTGCGFVQGIHVGKGDTYSDIYDGQWIDVTGVAPGSYFLQVTVDASDAMLESDETNNTIYVPVTLTNTNGTGGIALDRFETAAGGPNNTFESATNLGELGVQTQSGLTMHADADTDFFRFTAASSGTYAVELVVADRIVDLYVYDQNRNRIGQNTTPNSGSGSSPVVKRVTTSFIAGQTYFVQADGFSGSGSGTGTGGLSNNYALRVLVNPTATALAPTSIAAEDGLAEGSLRVGRNGPFSSALDVAFTVGGTATRGVDYNLVYNGSVLTTNTIIIGVESFFEDIRVVPISDALVEADETVTLTLNSSTAYVVGGSAASVVLRDKRPVAVASSFSPSTNRISFDFSLDVSASLTAGDLLIRDTATSQLYSASSVVWDAVNRRATFAVAGLLPRGNFEAVINRTNLTHAQGAPLASDATLAFNYAPADFDLSGGVGFTDLLALSRSYGMTSGATYAQGDADYDGDVDFADLLILARNYGEATRLPLNIAAFAGSGSTTNIGRASLATGSTATRSAQRTSSVDLIA